jgi:UDPglucose 6-dehydrogenase
LDIGIIGMGSVGNAVLKGMEAHHGVVGYDIDGRGEWDAILQTKAVLVCVPTDLSENRRNGDEYRRWRILCNGPVQEVATRLDESAYKGIVIYKSTLNVGTMDNLVASHPQLRLVYMPEFLREKDAEAWFADPDRLVASGDDGDVEEALSLFEWVSSTVPRMPMKHMEAEIGKLAHNAYIATKVTFTCEMERLCLLHDVDPHPVMETVWRDRRVLNPAHLTPGLGGFDGKCVPKDTEALASIDWCSLRYDSKGRWRDQSLIQTGLLQHVLMIGTKKSVMKRHNRASIGGRESRRQPKGKLEKTFDSVGNIIIKTLNFTTILGLFILCAFGIWAGGDYLWDYDSEHYIVDLNDSSFNFNEQDYLTILSFNSSMIDYETTEHAICYPNYSPDYYGEDSSGYNGGYYEGQECDSYTNYHSVLVNESGNYSFALSGNGSFLDDCFQTNCMVVGKVREVNNKHYWVEVTDYRII